MKSKKRHELQTNELADNLGHYLERVQPYYKPIGIAVAAVVVLGLFFLWQSNNRRIQQAASWEDYFAAFASRDADALEDVARVHSGTEAAIWALQAAGDIKLAVGSGDLYTNRDDAKKSLSKAEECFKAVEEKGRKFPLLVERARLSLAQTYEALSDVDAAQEYYALVAKASPDSAIGVAAQQRYDELAEPSNQEFYVWFEKQKPVLGQTEQGGLDGPNITDDLDLLPERPDLSFPDSAGSDSGIGPELTGPFTPTETPAATDDPDAKPTEEPEAKPTEEPEAKPTEKPEAKPTEELEAKPTEEPEAKATEKPEAKPADTSDDEAAGAGADEGS